MTRALRIAIAHYHLRRGGVTRVIEHTQKALSDLDTKIVIFSGEPSASDTLEPCVESIEGLGYRGSSAAPDEWAAVLRTMRESGRRHLGGDPDIWHIHNHTLGKNIVMPHLAHALAEQGQRVLLHIHDFVEDGRPDNYRFLLKDIGGGDIARLGAVLYPVGDHVHYVVLNGRDRAFLMAAGIPAGHVHRLPNPVYLNGADIGSWTPSAEADTRLFVYPVRAIRRKNIGEFILWSALGGAGDRFVVTLAPENPIERAPYEEWVAFAEHRKLPVAFATGERRSFTEMLREAYVLVTTSIAEGFGLAFLESWLAHRPLLGRDLPEITQEFTREGLDLSGFYERLDVPVEWVGYENLFRKTEDHLRAYFNAYERSLGADDVRCVMDTMVNEGMVDFGRLDEAFQRQVIEKITASPGKRSFLYPSILRMPEGGQERIEKNSEIIRRVFNIEQYGERLMAVYDQMLAAPASSLSAASVNTLLDGFMAPERFRLLRT